MTPSETRSSNASGCRRAVVTSIALSTCLNPTPLEDNLPEITGRDRSRRSSVNDE